MRSEHTEQAALVQRVRWLMPDVLVFAIPNGGQRNPGEATRLKAEGVLAGVPDLMIPEPRGDSHGLFVEMKRAKGGAVSPAQRSMHAELAARGYRVVVARGADEAFRLIEGYLNADSTAPTSS